MLSASRERRAAARASAILAPIGLTEELVQDPAVAGLAQIILGDYIRSVRAFRRRPLRRAHGY
jgi:hypothetical protein